MHTHTPTGVLVAKRSLFHNSIPHVPGGGTVIFVSANFDFLMLSKFLIKMLDAHTICITSCFVATTAEINVIING